MKTALQSDIPGDRRRFIVSALLFAASFCLYFFTRSISLDEWDSVQFALGVEEFNLWKHQPHPSGYPLYIFSGRLLATILRVQPGTALLLTSCLGGALLAAVWFSLLARQFGQKIALACGASLLFLPSNWMTATKVLTDMPATACLALQLLFAFRYEREKRLRFLGFSIFAGALCAGFRPQMTFLVFLILILLLVWSKATNRTRLLGIVLLIVFCALWLVPTMISQAQLPESGGDWAAYPKQLWKQWRWRLDRPNEYLGAGDFSPRYLYNRIRKHWYGWFRYGFGFDARSPLGLAGYGLYLAGIFLYFRRGLFRRAEHAGFWKRHLPWALFLIATVFFASPDHQRYYTAIFPLLLFPALSGLASLRGPWPWSALFLPGVLAAISLPVAIEAHGQEAPPIRMIRHLQREHLPAERPRVLLFLRGSFRHGQWYAPEFRLERVGRARYRIGSPLAIYTDNPNGLRKALKQASFEKIATFERSRLIWSKHRKVTLYRVRLKEAGG